ncbi:MAG: long-chain fatty aldehyde decarbonylase [Myxococcales bacterium]|nr:long-chain fatty aldehyde decarbonylase [Myxococcales bacterium]
MSDRDGYRDLLAYILSNAIAGEITAVDNYSELVHLLPDPGDKLATVTQAQEEARHIKQLVGLATKLGFEVQSRVVEPQWTKVRGHFHAAVLRRDVTACWLVQDVMTESMAIVLYEILSDPDRVDETTAQVASRILKDELEHLDEGIARLAQRRSADPRRTEDALVWAHHRVMPELFSLIATSCHFLCDELGMDCGSLDLAHLKLDLDETRAQALERYLDSLDRIGFPDSATSPLVASMAAYGRDEPLHIGFAARAAQ